jgi:MFS family permease
MFQLAAFRAVQGIGAGGLFALALTVLADIVPPRERARYQGMFLAVFGTSSVLGPVVGGLFASADSLLFVDGWRWVFLMNIPIGAVALLMVYTFLHVPHTPKPQRIDWWGAVTIVLAVVPLLLVAENGNDWGWGSSLSITMYVVGGAGILAFILAERAAKESALLPLALFRSSSFSMSTIVGVIVGFAMFGGMMTLPLMLQLVNGATPTESGLMMLPMVLGMMMATMVAGQVTRKTGHYRSFLMTGTFMMLVGLVYMTGYSADMPYWQISIGMVLIGLGLGQLMQTLTLVAQQSVPASDIGVATSSATFFRQMGGTLGVAVFISILFNSLGDKIGEAFKNKQILADITAAAQDPAVLADPNNREFLMSMTEGSDSAALSDQLKTDSSFLNNLDPRLARPFEVGFADSAVQVFIWASVVAAIAFALSFFVKAPPLRDTSAAQEVAAASAGH